MIKNLQVYVYILYVFQGVQIIFCYPNNPEFVLLWYM